MSLATQISNLSTRLGTEFKTVYALVGSLNSLSTTSKTSFVTALNEVHLNQGSLISLTTTQKSSLVAAINEIKTALANAAGINDAVTGTTTTWSSTKTNSAITSALNALVGASPELLNTLAEISTALGNDPNFATTITSALAGKAPTSHTHTTAQVTGLPEALAARVLTLDLGDPATNFVTVFDAALI